MARMVRLHPPRTVDEEEEGEMSIRFTSMTRANIDPADALTIGTRAMEMGADIGVMWEARARRYASGASKDGHRSEAYGQTVAEALTKALDGLERILAPWTPDELVTIAAQSGLEVRRG
jgi:hypothetical protein